MAGVVVGMVMAMVMLMLRMGVTWMTMGLCAKGMPMGVVLPVRVVMPMRVVVPMGVAMPMMSMAKGQHADKIHDQACEADRQELTKSLYMYTFCQSFECLIDNLNAN